MELPDHLHCLFAARIDAAQESYTIEVPKRELEKGDLDAGQSYRVALFPVPDNASTAATDATADTTQSPQDPPVEEGEQRVVEIDDIGEQGDGVARVERGYVVIVPDTDLGERVRVEMDHVKPNVAFAEVVDRFDRYV